MISIRELVKDSDTLSNGLKNNGLCHQNYRMYTSMDSALDFLLSGKLYLSDGSLWNDVNDRVSMNESGLFARCFSCSTRENIAMWMLYGGNKGKNGAALVFYPRIISHIKNVDEVKVGIFGDDHKFVEKGVLNRVRDDFEAFFTDVLYIDNCQNGKVRITCERSSVVSDEKVINGRDIFCKNYAWEYEKECRLVIRLSKKWKEIVSRENWNVVCLTVNKKDLNRMRESSLIRSPIYSGRVDYGINSQLYGTVDWDV